MVEVYPDKDHPQDPKLALAKLVPIDTDLSVLYPKGQPHRTGCPIGTESSITDGTMKLMVEKVCREVLLPRRRAGLIQDAYSKESANRRCRVGGRFTGGSGSGCTIIGTMIYNVTGPPPVNAQFDLPVKPTIVMVENYINPDGSTIDADQIAHQVTDQLKEHTKLTMLDPDKLSRYSGRGQG